MKQVPNVPYKYLQIVAIRQIGCAHVHVQRKEDLQRHWVRPELQTLFSLAVYLISTMITS